MSRRAGFVFQSTGLGLRLRGSREDDVAARSLGQLPPPSTVCGMLEAAGFRGVAGRPLTGGMVTLFAGTRA